VERCKEFNDCALRADSQITSAKITKYFRGDLVRLVLSHVEAGTTKIRPKKKFEKIRQWPLSTKVASVCFTPIFWGKKSNKTALEPQKPI